MQEYWEWPEDVWRDPSIDLKNAKEIIGGIDIGTTSTQAVLMSDGKLAIGFFNLSDDDRELSLQFWDLGLTSEFGQKLKLFDCWEQKDLGTFNERYVAKVPAHGCQIVLAELDA